MSAVLFLEFTVEPVDLEAIYVAFEKIAAHLELRDGFMQSRTLRNTDDPRVFLLESTWQAQAPTLEELRLEPVPGSVKTRTWMFTTLEPRWESV